MRILEYHTAGSPPPMRGKAAASCSAMISAADHPRLCGEKSHFSLTLSFPKGSPPPMRGKVSLLTTPPAGYRITPAYAGKSVEHADVIVKMWDHPRLCGEKKWFMTKKTFMAGSPPPMRGKALHTFLISCYYRITPAYAGKSRPKATVR